MIEEMRLMVDKLNKWSYEYYTLDAPTVSDAVYDALYDKLLEAETKSGTVLSDSPTKRVGGAPIAAFGQHAHIKRLFSLDKAQAFPTLSEWIEKINKKFGEVLFTVELKYDGLNLNLTYAGGLLTYASTRGDGVTGENVTEQVRTVKSVPLSIEYKGKIELQGECYMRLSAFKKFNEKYPDEALKSPRNGAAGAVRNLDPAVTARRKLDVVFYSCGYMSESVITDQTGLVSFLNLNRFRTSHIFKTARTFEEIKAIIDEITSMRDGFDFMIDGIVIKVNDFNLREELGYTEKFPKWAIAFKFEAEETITRLCDVDWRVGRTGKVTPLAILEPVELAGATISRATLNNYDDIIRKNLKINSTVCLRRSNEVIPEILYSVESPLNAKEISPPEVCPSCGAGLERKGAHIFCHNTDCKAQIIAKIVHYSSKDSADIEGLSIKTITQLVEKLGLKTVDGLYALTETELSSLDGYKEKKINSLLKSIENSKNVSLSGLIHSLGISTVGLKTSKDLAKEFKDMKSLINADAEKLICIDEVGGVMAESIVDFFMDESNISLIAKLKFYGIDPVYGGASGVLTGKRVVLTGSLEAFSRDQAVKLIEERGGEVMSGVGKAVNLVIAGKNAGSKLQKAKDFKIEIWDEERFLAEL